MTQVTRELIELAERVEKAEGADRRLDAEIGVAAGLRVVDEGHPLGLQCYTAAGQSVPLPRYTSSIDAAMSLVDPAWWLNLGGPMSPAAYGYSREDQREKRVGFQMLGEPYSAGARGETFALALCAAALRARSAATL